MLGKIAVLAAVLAVLVVLPFTATYYSIEIFILFLINLILVTSYRLQTTTGDWSLSHVVMMGVGAYSTALIAKFLGWPIWLTVPLSGLSTAIIGAVICYPLLRTRGFGFFIASFAIGEFLRLVWVKFHNPFGGPRGMIGIPSGELGTIDLFEPIPYYFFVLVVALVSVGVMYRIEVSRLGKTFKALYADEMLSECVGIDVQRFRALAFIIASFFAGIAGSLLAHRLGAIDPKNFDINTMVYLIIWVVVGGTRTFWGAVIGLTVMTVIFEWSRPLLEWRPALFGGILIASLVFLPGGLESLFIKARQGIRWLVTGRTLAEDRT